jgi:hypothetical protein
MIHPPRFSVGTFRRRLSTGRSSRWLALVLLAGILSVLSVQSSRRAQDDGISGPRTEECVICDGVLVCGTHVRCGPPPP